MVGNTNVCSTSGGERGGMINNIKHDTNLDKELEYMIEHNNEVGQNGRSQDFFSEIIVSKVKYDIFMVQVP